MGILHSLIRMPCLAPAPSPPASSTTSSTTKITTQVPFPRDKGRASPTKADISHPYPLAPRSGRRASMEAASPSSRFRARSPRSPRSPFAPLATVTPMPASAKRRGIPIRAATSPDTIRERDRERDRGLIASAPSSPCPGSIRLPGAHGAHITFDSQLHPRSITSSPAPYSPPESITSLVPRPRPPNGLCEPCLISSVIDPRKEGTSRRKLRKILMVEGDWEMVRQGDCDGFGVSGRPGRASNPAPDSR